MGIGVNQTTEVYSPPLTAGSEPADPMSPTFQLNGEDHAQQSGILIHTDTPVVSHGRSKSQDLDGDTHLSSPMPSQAATLPISPALSASAQLINNASEKIPADQLPSTVRPGVPIRAPSKIRFAPLPNPRRQRSMSTGRNIAVKATMEPDGTRTLQRSAKRDKEDEGFYQDQGSGTSSRYLDEHAVDDEEDDDEDEDDDEGGDGRGKRSSWKTMGMGNWKSGSFSSGSYTKKLLGPLLNPAATTGTGGSQGPDNELERLTSRESGRRISADIAMPGSQSLRKTFSTTSGFIGSSPFRTAGEHERKRNFFPGSSTSGASGGQQSASGAAFGLLGIGGGGGGSGDKKGKQTHRASNTPDFSSLSASLGRQADTEFAPEGRDVATSPRPVKMLNGRVYGKNRQSAQGSVGSKTPVEPEFVEWGGMMGSKSGGLGSVASTTAVPSSSTRSMGSVGGRAGGNDDEEDDGSGISWVKKRREARERERRASEFTPTEEITSPGLYAGSLPTSSELHNNWQRGSANPIAVDAVAHLPAVSEDRVATPIDAEHFAFNNTPSSHQRQELSSSSGMPEQPPWLDENLSSLGRMQAQDERHANDDPGHIVQAVQIPASPTQAVQWRQSFPTEGDGHELPSLGSAVPLQSPDDDYEEEDGVEGDFESDDEEELAAEEIKKR